MGALVSPGPRIPTVANGAELRLVLVFGAVREADLIRQPEVLLGSRCGGVSKAFLSAVALALVLPACGGVALTPKRDTDAGDGTDLSVMTGADAANSTTVSSRDVSLR